MNYQRAHSLLLGLLLLTFTASLLLAQSVVTGDLSGTVTDATGAIVPQATVTLKSDDGNTLKATSSQSGAFRFPLLKPGVYAISASAVNMQSAERKVDILLGQVTSLTLQLGVTGASTTIEVTEEAPLLQTENANISTSYSQKQIEELPNPGGDITYYAQTAPGVAMNVGGSVGNFTAFGLPATSNLFTVNGNDENDPFLNVNNSGSSNLTLGQNELQNVAIVSNGYTGQYGRQAGVQEDVSTKSGDNAFHGNANYYWNGRALNANEWFNKQGGNKTPFANANQWSASFGGPIIKNKTFFFVDTEGLHYILPTSGRIFLPTPAFETAVLNNINAASPAQTAFYKQLFNLYNNAPGIQNATPITTAFDPSGNFGCADFAGTLGFGTAATPCANSLETNGKNLNKEWLLITRVDQNIGNNDKLFGRFRLDHGQQPTTTDLINPALFSTQSIQPSYEGQLNETHIFSPNAVNQAIISGLWYTAVFKRDSGETAALAALPYSTILFTGALPFSPLGGTTPGAPDVIFPQGRNVTQYQGIDDFSLTRGNHTFKMGANFRRNDISDYDNSTFLSGLVLVNNLTDFYNGVANGANFDGIIQNFTNHPRVPLAIYSLGVYFQDEWRISSTLKLTMALRADRNSNAVCQSNCFSRLATDFSQLTHDVNTPYNQAIQSGMHSAFQDLEKVALQPRVGITWSPFGHSNTVVRGGLGVFSDLYQGILLDGLAANSPTLNGFTIGVGNPALANAPYAPTANGSIAQIAAGSNASFISAFSSGATLAQIQATNPFFAQPSFFSVTNKVNNPKYIEWNLEVQHEFGSKTSLNLNYVGTHGYNILVYNGTENAFAPAGKFGTLPSAPIDTRFGPISALSSVGVSNYAGLVTTVTRKFSYGFQGSLNYTYSHALDDITTTNPGTSFNVVHSLVYQVDPNSLRSLNYGNSDADIRHNLTANYVWELPYKFQNGFLQHALGGWMVSGTLFVRSGLPYSAIDPTAPVANVPGNGYTALATLLPGQSLGSCSTPGSLSTPTQCLSQSQFVPAGTETGFGNVARNSFRGPGYFDTDFSVLKNFRLTERIRFSVGANLYNAFNHPNFGNPDPNVSHTTFGQILNTVVQPTGPYGSFQGAGVSGRLVQITGKLSF